MDPRNAVRYPALPCPGRAGSVPKPVAFLAGVGRFARRGLWYA